MRIAAIICSLFSQQIYPILPSFLHLGWVQGMSHPVYLVHARYKRTHILDARIIYHSCVSICNSQSFLRWCTYYKCQFLKLLLSFRDSGLCSSNYIITAWLSLFQTLKASLYPLHTSTVWLPRIFYSKWGSLDCIFSVHAQDQNIFVIHIPVHVYSPLLSRKAEAGKTPVLKQLL